MSSIFSTQPRKGFAAVALIATARLSMAACGTTDDIAKESSTNLSVPKPVAAIDSLTGNTTQIALDQGFVDALSTLTLTPGTGRQDRP